MKGLGKSLAAGIVIIIFGVAILLVALGLNGWTLKTDWESMEFESQSQITSLHLDYSAGDVETVFYDGDKIRVEYPTSKVYKTEVKEADGKLSVISGKRHWYDFSLWWFLKVPTARIYIPNGSVIDLDIILNAGTLKIPDGGFGKVDIKMNAGKIDLGKIESEKFDCYVNAGALYAENIICGEFRTEVNAGSADFKNLTSASVNLKVNAGSLNADINGNENDYTVTVDKNAGSCNISDHTGATDKKINVEVNAGSVSVNFKN